MARTRRGFGALRRLPSKRWQASYTGPDLQRYNAPVTFEAKIDGEEWLAAERRLVSAEDWMPPGQRRSRQGLTFETYAQRWLSTRELKPSTVGLYRGYLDRTLLPAFGHRLIAQIKPADVRAWHATLDPTLKTRRAHAYSLLRSILDTAVTEEVILSNPCTIRGAGQTKRARRVEPATLEELAALVAAMPDRLALMPLLAAWCAMRFGEVAELQRRDVDLERGRISITRAMVRVDGADVVGTPKSAAGVRVVAIPPHLIPIVAQHLAEHVRPGRQALLFPLSPEEPTLHMVHSRYYQRWHVPAREAAGRPDLTFHDLRHTGATMAARTGATLAELMARLGHSTPGAALRYQHSAAGRDDQIAAALSRMAEGDARE